MHVPNLFLLLGPFPSTLNWAHQLPNAHYTHGDAGAVCRPQWPLAIKLCLVRIDKQRKLTISILSTLDSMM